MSECVCDWEQPDFYRTKQTRARKAHFCYECDRKIAPGEHYEYNIGKWEGSIETSKTCFHCLALRDYIIAHVPCFCWMHGSIIDDAIETAKEWSHEAPGLLFGAYRLKIHIKRQQLLSKKPITKGIKPVYGNYIHS